MYLKKKSVLRSVIKNLKVISFVKLEFYNNNNMARYISSVVVVLSPKGEHSSDLLVSKVLGLDYISGASISHATHFVSKSPLITPYLSKYNIVSFTFKYSDL